MLKCKLLSAVNLGNFNDASANDGSFNKGDGEAPSSLKAYLCPAFLTIFTERLFAMSS